MSSFQIFTLKEIAHLRKAGEILRACLEETAKQVSAGATTGDLDRFAEAFIVARGGKPAFKGYHGFPATLCTSVNEECVHGIPGKRVLQDGDIVSLDGGVIVGGLYTDACVTVPVGMIPADVQTFLDKSKAALEAACAIVKPGIRIGDISATIQQMVEGDGYSCVKALTGHGLGSTLHQYPDIPNVGKHGSGPIVPPHTIIAIEPITAMGAGGIRDGDDGWTIVTADGSLSAHFEHTVLVTGSGYEILA
jgi:methionyl aminopeptidase